MSETIGQKLRSSREGKRLSIEQVADATRIRSHYLEALERDDLSAIPSTAQARGFLRIYADFIGLDADQLAPVARPPEPRPIVSLSDTSTPLGTDPSTAPAQEAISTPAPARPNLLTSLRDRFTRRSNIENVSDTSSSGQQPAAPEPEFVPARYTEELPAEPAPVEIEKPSTKEPTKPARRSSGKKAIAAKKPVLQKAKASPRAKVEKKSEVKKKITKKSHLKRGSSSHRLSSSPMNRVSGKTSNRKSKKRA